MTDAVVTENHRGARTLDRRTMLRAGAWSIPVIAVAVSAPRAAASVPAVCEILPVGSFVVAGGMLTNNGKTGEIPTETGLFGTGWTPAKEPTGDAVNGYVQTDAAVAPVPAGWWQGAGVIGDPGFLSLDDHDNLDGADRAPVTVTLRFAAGVQAGTTYQLGLPIYSAAPQNGTQYLDVSVQGAGVDQPSVVQGVVGTKTISEDIQGLDGYPTFAAAQTPTITIAPTETGTVFFTYTFTLAYVHGGPRQNADMFVQAPRLLTCE